jgi:predicted TIM-barrel fold metal-dependent hydrolase
MSSLNTGRKPVLAAPAGACDCHIHIFGPRKLYPLAADPAYIPSDAPVEAYLAVRNRLGIERAVVVQPSAYGTDNRCMLDAIAALSPTARGIAVVEPSITDQELERLHEAGVRGLRFSLTVKNSMRPDCLEEMARRIRPFGWHVQFRSTHRDLPDMEPLLARLPADVCIDHLGSIPPEEPLAHPAWQSIFRLLEHGHCWVKLSAPYQLSRKPGLKYADFASRVAALVKAAPNRLVWGTNWPHPSVSTIPDDADLLDCLAEWIPEASVRRAILVDNPAVLYGFPRAW